MTIDEATKLIQADIDDKDGEWNSPLGEAYELSFEALKWVQKERPNLYGKYPPLLPGETKE